jgi:mediator of RNA polymerase II transcription subunit 12, fungi type
MLTAVIETIYRYVDIWACMERTASIATALYASHQLWRAQGVQSRKLLALLVEIDNGRHLDRASRAHVAADTSSFKDVKSF